MSAIAGIVELDGSRPCKVTTSRMVNLLRPYGTDSSDLCIYQNKAFVRTLLRTTPQDRNDVQPLFDSETKSFLVWDGRIDNREDLARELGLDTGDANEMADSLLAFRYLLKFSQDRISQIIGDFALAFWSGRSDSLILARDALGVRPLYWYKDEQRFIWGTLPKAIFAVPGVEKAIDEEIVQDYLCLIPIESGRSLFKGISRIDPGHMLVLKSGCVSVRPYYEFSSHENNQFAKDEDYVEALQNHIQVAVESRLRSSGRIASELSSGLDSTTISAFAAKSLQRENRNLICYTSVPREGFEGPVIPGFYADEGPGATMVAKRFPNIQHELFRTGSTISLDCLEEFVQAADRPPLNVTNLPWSIGIKKQAVQDGCRVLLNGGLGNYSISYDGYELLPRLLWEFNWLSWFKQSAAVRRTHPGVGWRWLLSFSLGAGMPGPLWSYLQKAKGQGWDIAEYSAVSQSALERFKSFSRAKKLGLDLSYRPGIGGKRKLLLALRRVDIGDYYAAYNFFGLEVRSPAIDRRLVEFCLSVPERLYLRNGVSKWLLKQVVKELLPSEIIENRGVGLQAADWHEAYEPRLEELRESVHGVLSHESVKQFLDSSVLESLVNNWPKGNWHHRSVHSNYRLKLLRGIGVGSFIKYVDDRNG